MSDITTILTKYAVDIDDTIKAILADSPDFLRGVMSYHFGWVDKNFEAATSDRGKMVRPVMCLLTYEALTGSHRAALPAAAAIEIIHNFSLLHDDIEDNDIERRGRPTAWTIWGKPLVINVGDHLYSLAYKTIYTLDAKQFSPERLFAVFRLLNEACIALTEGQDLDLRFETVAEVSTEMYIDMVYKKTGALLEAAILAGARLGTDDPAILQNYYNFARNIGIAFQIRDDILGIWGDSAETGKSVANDLYRKKKTLPIIYMLAETTGERQAQLREYYATSDPLSTEEQIEFVRDSLTQVGAYDYAQKMANHYQEEAFKGLHDVNLDNEAQHALKTIANFLIERTY